MSLATTADLENQAPRVRGRSKSARATSSQPAVKPKKVSFYLTPDALRRLDIHVAMEGGDRSRLVEALIQEELRRFEMPRRRPEATVTVRESAGDGAFA